MAHRLQEDGDSSASCRGPADPCDGASVPIGHPGAQVAGIPGSHVHGREDFDVGAVPQALHPPEPEELRQQAWPVQSMSRLRQEVAMGRQHASVGRTQTVAKAAAAAAFAIIAHGCCFPGSPLQTGLGGTSPTWQQLRLLLGILRPQHLRLLRSQFNTGDFPREAFQ